LRDDDGSVKKWGWVDGRDRRVGTGWLGGFLRGGLEVVDGIEIARKSKFDVEGEGKEDGD
jgi:hypothetical protein